MAVILGAVGLALGAVTPVRPLRTIWTLGVPLAAMALYVIAVRLRDRMALSTLQFGDSVYFLGFLFTLMSLSVSLLRFTGGTADSADFADHISRFGTALLTTIVGLSLRIYFTSFRESPEETLVRSEQSLSEASEALRRQLDRLSQDMTVQQKVMTDSLSAAIELTAAELKAAGESGRAALETAVGSAKASVEASALEGGQALKDALQHVAKRVKATRLPADLMTASVMPAVDALVSELESQREALASSGALQRDLLAMTTGLAQSGDSLERASAVLSTTLEWVEKGSARLQPLGDALGRLADAVDAMRSGFAEQEGTMARLRAEVEEGSQAWIRYREQMNESASDSRRALERVREEVVTAARFIREELGSDEDRS